MQSITLLIICRIAEGIHECLPRRQKVSIEEEDHTQTVSQPIRITRGGILASWSEMSASLATGGGVLKCSQPPGCHHAPTQVTKYVFRGSQLHQALFRNPSISVCQKGVEELRGHA